MRGTVDAGRQGSLALRHTVRRKANPLAAPEEKGLPHRLTAQGEDGAARAIRGAALVESEVKCGAGLGWRVLPKRLAKERTTHRIGFIQVLGAPQLSQPKSGRKWARMA